MFSRFWRALVKATEQLEALAADVEAGRNSLTGSVSCVSDQQLADLAAEADSVDAETETHASSNGKPARERPARRR